MTERNEDTQDLRDLFAGLAMMGDWATQEPMQRGFCPDDAPMDDLMRRARLYYRMARAMLKVREES